ncbi:DUF4921 family protein [Candidatus Woesearchaeota archaeon]|nr:DUF4921 family protein [Candidatus Woesearchaeota archaeon]
MELRKDYILSRFVILASGRKERPRDFSKEAELKHAKICYFCPGNEKMTPKEIGRVPKGKGWEVRWFENKFPAVEPKGKARIRADGSFHALSDAYGYHEIIVDTPSHSKQLWDLNNTQIEKLFCVYMDRIRELSAKKNVKHVAVFKNYGRDAGTSLIHSHTQVAALGIVPPYIKEKNDAVEKFRRCPYCDIMSIERKSSRLCYENDSMIAFAPFASRFNYEVWVFPKRHVTGLSEFSKKEMEDLGRIMKKILAKLKRLGISYNYCLQYSRDLHFHIEVLPRAEKWGGFEYSSGIIINSVYPENAAKFYRGYSKGH